MGRITRLQTEVGYLQQTLRERNKTIATQNVEAGELKSKIVMLNGEIATLKAPKEKVDG